MQGKGKIQKVLTSSWTGLGPGFCTNGDTSARGLGTDTDNLVMGACTWQKRYGGRVVGLGKPQMYLWRGRDADDSDVELH